LFQRKLSAFSASSSRNVRGRSPLATNQQPNRAIARLPREAARACSLTWTGTMGLFTKDIKTMNDLFVH
jgi:hypothetical protein